MDSKDLYSAMFVDVESYYKLDFSLGFLFAMLGWSLGYFVFSLTYVQSSSYSVYALIMLKGLVLYIFIVSFSYVIFYIFFRNILLWEFFLIPFLSAFPVSICSLVLMLFWAFSNETILMFLSFLYLYGWTTIISHGKPKRRFLVLVASFTGIACYLGLCVEWLF